MGIWEDEANDCLSFYYLGLRKARYGATGSGCGNEWQDVRKISCDDLQLNDNNCDHYHQADYAAYYAAILAIASVLIKLINLLLANCHTHQRVLKLFIFAVAGSDFCNMILAIIAC